MTGLMSINPGTVVFTIINLLILMLFLKHFLFGKVNKVLDDRQKEVKDAFDEAEQASKKAKELEIQYNTKISQAKEESAEIVKQATQKAQTRSDEIVADAKHEASAIMDKANSEIEREKKRAVNEIKDQISDIAFSVAEKVIEKEVDKKDNDRLIEDFIKNVGEL